MRACIGRSFAWQEAILVVAMVLQNFDVKLKDPQYEIHVDQTLTIKPRDFEIRAALRTGITATILKDRLSSDAQPAYGENANATGEVPRSQNNGQAGKAVQIMFGTTTGKHGGSMIYASTSVSLKVMLDLVDSRHLVTLPSFFLTLINESKWLPLV